MPQTSTNLLLTLDQVPDDDAILTGTWINSQSGYSSTSNMQKIDAFAGETRNSITDLKGSGYTNQTVKGNYDLIQSTNQKITYTATVTGTNTLVGTIPELTSIQNNINIKIIPSTANTSSVTVNINSTGALPLVKVQNWTGSTVYAPLTDGDLQPNNPILITKSNDGLRYIWLELENSANHIYFKNATNDFTDLQSKLTTMVGDISSKAPLNNPTFTSNINLTTINLKTPSYAVTPTETLITTGFTSGWSGFISNIKNQENFKTTQINLTKSSDIASGSTVVYTLSSGFRPTRNQIQAAIIQDTVGNFITTGYATLITDGTVIVYVSATVAGARNINITMSYY